MLHKTSLRPCFVLDQFTCPVFCANVSDIILVPSGEAAAETMAEGSDMVIQELPQNHRQPNAGRGLEQLTPREGFGTLAKAQNAHISGHVGSVNFCRTR